MEELILQHIVMSSDVVPGTGPLFCSNRGGAFPMDLDDGERIDLRSRFNFIPAGVLKRFGVNEIVIDLRLEGCAKIALYADDSAEPFLEKEVDGPLVFTIPKGDLIGMVIEAIGKCRLSGGCVSCQVECLKPVRLGHVICTYRREEYITPKLRSITEFLDSINMSGKYDLIVVDNEGTFGFPELEIIHSDNLGGSAGFSRGMMVALNRGCTHILINDDDALLEPEVLFRTVSLLSLTGDDVVIGGTMLSLEHPCTVYESGAYCDNKVILSLKHGLDVSDVKGNVELSRPELIGHTGWWYSVSPASLVKRIGYSLPFFIKEDDVEYGLRSDIEKITVCGISIWHPEPKYDPAINYYYFRNHMATMASHNLLDRKVIKLFTLKIWLEISSYRYENAEMMILGLKEFLKGPDLIYHRCEEKRVTRKMEYRPLDELRNEEDFSSESPKHGVAFRLMTMNGLFFPSAGCTEKSIWDMEEADFYRMRKILYSIDDHNGFIAEKKIGKTVRMSFVSVLFCIRLMLSKRKMNRIYGEKLSLYSSEEQWKRMLRME